MIQTSYKLFLDAFVSSVSEHRLLSGNKKL